jgi:hypothetical protein
MRPRLIPLLFLFSFYSQAQLSSGQPFVALVADNVYKNGHLPVTNLEHFKGNEILYVRGFLSLVHRSGLSWEFRDTVVHLAGMGIPKIKKAQFDGRLTTISFCYLHPRDGDRHIAPAGGHFA